MTLKKDFIAFVKEELSIPLVGIASADDFAGGDAERINTVLQLFSHSTPLAEGMDAVLNPRDFMAEARAVIVTGTPGYFGRMKSFDDCRKGLLGGAEPSHVNIRHMQHSQEKQYLIADFFTRRGYMCCTTGGMQFPVKLAAARCGVGFYGKNAVIQHPGYGAWIGLMAYVTDALLEPDEALTQTCPDRCTLCLDACPTGALYAPYRCDAARCIDFNLGHNKKTIAPDIREKCGNLLGEGCTACRDACPNNRNIKTLQGFDPPEELLHPALLAVFNMTDEEWDRGYAQTMMGFFLTEKKYLQRNALIGLGNFRDERALSVLTRILAGGDDELRGYAAWALGMIGGSVAKKYLAEALIGEKNENVIAELRRALTAG
jgi:epoxyqueuosine reductase